MARVFIYVEDAFCYNVHFNRLSRYEVFNKQEAQKARIKTINLSIWLYAVLLNAPKS